MHLDVREKLLGMSKMFTNLFTRRRHLATDFPSLVILRLVSPSCALGASNDNCSLLIIQRRLDEASEFDLGSGFGKLFIFKSLEFSSSRDGNCICLIHSPLNIYFIKYSTVEFYSLVDIKIIVAPRLLVHFSFNVTTFIFWIDLPLGQQSLQGHQSVENSTKKKKNRPPLWFDVQKRSEGEKL